MKIGFVGLGKMGGNMTKRLIDSGHEVVAYARSEASRNGAAPGVETVSSLPELVKSLEKQIIWLMVPSESVDKVLDDLLPLLAKDAVVIDGGNSDFRLTVTRTERVENAGIRFVDVGTSGGILGLKRGYAMMIGGDESSVKDLAPIFDALAPPGGWHYFGQHGSGHYVKMVHNAIEYGIMESYAEGYRLLKEGPFEKIDLAAAGNVWQHASIIQSLLNQLITEALEENPQLEGIEGYVHESGEARWALEVAKDHSLETPSISASFEVRLRSQKGETNFATKLLAAMRNKFGGHAINKESQ